MKRNIPSIAWLDEHVRKEVDGCWIWQGAIATNGYGRVRVYGGNSQPAHKIALQIYSDPVPKGMFVCHRCDRPACCNPSHLFVGTPKENTRDSIAKGRFKFPSNDVKARGERAGQSKLTNDAVLAIRDALRSRGYREVLAEQYGVTIGTIKDIRRRKTWRHL